MATHLPRSSRIPLLLFSILAFWLFDWMGTLEPGIPLLMSVLVFGLLARVKWRLRKITWFWITLAAFAATHVVLLCLLPWSKEWVPAAVTAVVASGDAYAMLVLISIVVRSAATFGRGA